jgi:mannose-1-phosphate guanylyltransferase
VVRADAERDDLQTHDSSALGSFFGNALRNQVISSKRIRRPVLLVRAHREDGNVDFRKILFSLRPTHLVKQNLQVLSHSAKSFYCKQREYKSAVADGEPLKAVILGGGFGTRLRPLSCTRPKILFPVVNKPLLQWTFERLAQNDIKDVVMAVFYQTEMHIKHHRVPRCGVHVSYSHDPLRKPLGTGGSIRKAEKLVGHDSMFIVLNGDIFADVNYTKILKEHRDRNALATIALHRVKDTSRYGVAELAEDNRTKRFIEKPLPGTTKSNLINAGAYAFSPEIFDYIPEGRAVSIEHEIFPKLAEEGKLYGHVFEGLWLDIGKPEDYLEINKKMLDLTANTQTPKIRGNVKVTDPVAVDRKVTIGEKSRIGPYAILGRNVQVGKNVTIQNSVVFPGTVISDFASVGNAIIGEDAFIGKGAEISAGCIIGDHAKIRDNVFLAEGVQVCPANQVSKSVLTPNSNC